MRKINLNTFHETYEDHGEDQERNYHLFHLSDYELTRKKSFFLPTLSIPTTLPLAFGLKIKHILRQVINSLRHEIFYIMHKKLNFHV